MINKILTFQELVGLFLKWYSFIIVSFSDIWKSRCIFHLFGIEPSNLQILPRQIFSSSDLTLSNSVVYLFLQLLWLACISPSHHKLGSHFSCNFKLILIKGWWTWLIISKYFWLSVEILRPVQLQLVFKKPEITRRTSLVIQETEFERVPLFFVYL